MLLTKLSNALFNTLFVLNLMLLSGDTPEHFPIKISATTMFAEKKSGYWISLYFNCSLLSTSDLQLLLQYRRTLWHTKNYIRSILDRFSFAFINCLFALYPTNSFSWDFSWSLCKICVYLLLCWAQMLLPNCLCNYFV